MLDNMEMPRSAATLPGRAKGYQTACNVIIYHLWAEIKEKTDDGVHFPSGREKPCKSPQKEVRHANL